MINDKMKVALVVFQVSSDKNTNLKTIIERTEESADVGANIILFPEASLTGLVNNDDPAHDIKLGEEIPGQVTEILSDIAIDKKIYLGVGLLEKINRKLYDSAVLVDPEGKIALHYRRIQPQWHGVKADPDFYCEGGETRKVTTPFGSFAFLICGDLFEEKIIKRVRHLGPDWILMPMARCFDDGSYDQERWDREESEEYIKQVRNLGITTFITNYIAGKDINNGAFGGALAVSGDGQIIKSLPLGIQGTLFVDIKNS